jgi:prolyl 4-hydroxylase
MLNVYKKFHSDASINSEDFLANPMNAYLLVKKLTRDWDNVQSVIVENVGECENNTFVILPLIIN